MAAGDLSPDQARFVDAFTAATGLSRQVVVAWVGSESGWGTTKAGHNYLNVGPGETYTSAEQAAARSAALVRTSNYYAGIRAAIPVGGTAQVEAIGSSPWGTSPATLTKVYAQLNGATTVPDGAGGASAKPVSLTSVAGDIIGTVGGAIGAITNPGAAAAGAVSGALGGVGTMASQGAGAAIKGLGDLTGKLGSALGIDVGSVVGGIASAFFSAALSIVFVVGAMALIALGLNRLTGTPPAERIAQIQKAVGTASTVAAVA